MKAPYHIETTTSGFHVLDGDDIEIAFCDTMPKAQRIADALNAAEKAPKTLTDVAGTSPEAFERYLGLNRNPDRVRLAAAALQGIMTHREAITQSSTRDPLWAEKMAVERADATLSQLDATAKKGTP